MLYIDSIKGRYRQRMQNDLLAQYWTRDETHEPNGHWSTKYRLNATLDNSAVIKCTYYQYSFDRMPLLVLDFSIPKVCLGNNFTIVEDKDVTIKKINQILTEIKGLPILDFNFAVINQVDFCYLHQVGDLVPHYIYALQQLEYSYRTTFAYSSEGVAFKNKQKGRHSKFYDKEKETGSPAAHGILKQELTRTLSDIQKLTGKKKPPIDDITIELQLQALVDDLKNLNIYGRSIGTRDSTLEHLCKVYGEYAGTYYYGLLHAKTSLPKDMLPSITGMHPRSLGRRIQKIVEAEIPPTLTEHLHPLPPLVIPGYESFLVSKSIK